MLLAFSGLLGTSQTISAADGAATGTMASSISGIALWMAVLTSTGVGTPAIVGAATFVSTTAGAGNTTLNGIGVATAGSPGSSNGLVSISGDMAAIWIGLAESSGAGTTTITGAIRADTVGSITNLTTAIGVGGLLLPMDGMSNGTVTMYASTGATAASSWNSAGMAIADALTADVQFVLRHLRSIPYGSRRLLFIRDMTNLSTTQVVTYREPITNVDLTPMEDLAYTNVYYQIGTDTPIKGSNLPASAATGGGIVSTAINVPVTLPTNVKFWSTSTDSSGNESGPSSEIVKSMGATSVYRGLKMLAAARNIRIMPAPRHLRV